MIKSEGIRITDLKQRMRTSNAPKNTVLTTRDTETPFVRYDVPSIKLILTLSADKESISTK
jgi:hypothetical protein